jgi:hypothetical protein
MKSCALARGRHSESNAAARRILYGPLREKRKELSAKKDW